MKIILSPAKKMNTDTDTLAHDGLPVFLDQTEEILKWLRARSRDELQNLWECNDKIAEQNWKRLKEMDLKRKVKGKPVTKGTYAKMARGEMVRFMAENQIEDSEEIKRFDRLGYVYRDDLSGDREIVFERK